MSEDTTNAPSSLPANLIGKIIDDLSADAASLRATGLTSRLWVPRTRQHLFRHITIGCSPQPHLRCTALKDIILGRPQIAGYIQTFDLTLGIEWGDSLGDGLPHGCCYECEEKEESPSKPALRLVELLPHLGSVRSFRLEGEGLYLPSHVYARLRRALYMLISSPKLKKLEMKDLGGVDISVIARCSNLVELVLENVDSDDWDEDEASRPSQHPKAGRAYDGLFQSQATIQGDEQSPREEEAPTLAITNSRYSLQTLVAVASYYKRRLGESARLSKTILRPTKLSVHTDMNDGTDFAPNLANALFDLCGRTIEEYDLLVEDVDVHGDPKPPSPFLTALPRLSNLRRLGIRTGPARCKTTLPTLVQQLATRAGAAETTGLETLELTLDNSIDGLPPTRILDSDGFYELTKLGPQLDEVLGVRTPGFQGLHVVVKTNVEKIFSDSDEDYFYGPGRSGKERWERFVGDVEREMKTLKEMRKIQIEIAHVDVEENFEDY